MPFTIFVKTSTMDVWYGSEYASELASKVKDVSFLNQFEYQIYISRSGVESSFFYTLKPGIFRTPAYSELWHIQNPTHIQNPVKTSMIRPFVKIELPEKCPNTEFLLVRIFPHSDWIQRETPYLSVFRPNAGKYGPEKTP